MTANKIMKEYSLNQTTFNVIDIRLKEQWEDFRIPSSVHVDLKLLINEPQNFLSKDKHYYILSDNGQSALTIEPVLNDKGYKVEALVGGMAIAHEWRPKNDGIRIKK